MNDNEARKAQQDVSRGVRAAEIMENPLVIEAFEAVEAVITSGWQNSKADDEKARENAYLMHRLVQNFKGEFKRAIATGKASEKRLLSTKDSTLKKILP